MKGKRLKSLSGTVLIMVLTVMLVLIIMLMATLTVVTTASQRIYTKYEEQQAYYTARSALDVFTNMLNDSKYGNTVGGTFETQGYNIQKSLYDIKAQSDPTGTNPVKNTNPYAGASGIMATQSYIEYSASLPDLNKGAADEYGKFDDGTLKIKVEVLDRTLNCGSDGTPATGKRTKDAMKLKITATTSFEGIESSAAMTLLTKAPPANAATRAVTITGGDDLEITNNSILGGLATEGKIDIGNKGDYWGNIYLGGEVNMTGDGSRLVATDDQWIYIKDGTSIQNNFYAESHLAGADESKRGNIVIGGDFKMGNNSEVGGNGNKIKMVVLGNMLPAFNNGHKHNGDLYIMGNVTVPMKLEVDGNMYVEGDCDFTNAQNGVTISGDLIVKGAYNDQYGTDGGGNPMRRTVTVGGHSYPADGISSGDTPEIDTEIKVGDDGVSRHVPIIDAQGYMEIEWPSSPGVPVKVATYGAVFTQFYRYADPANEDTITASEYAFLSQDDLDNLRKTAADGGKAPATEERIHEFIDAKTADGTAVNVSIALSDTINDQGVYIVNPGHCANGTLTIDAPGKTVELILKPGHYSNGGTFLVKNGTKLKVYGEPGVYNFDSTWQFITDEYLTGDVSNGGKLYVGDFGPVDPLNPSQNKPLMKMNINFYFEGESTINFNNDGTIFVGHFYAPRSTINLAGGVDISSRLVYNGVQYTPIAGQSPKFSFIGSLLCAKYKTNDSKGGIAFVQTTEEDPDDGLPCLQFDASQYTRQ